MRRIILSTLLIVAAALSLEARIVDRGLGNSKTVYIEKGTWQFGLKGSYSSYDATALEGGSGTSLYGLIDNVRGDARFGGIASSLSWFFADNTSIGAYFGYDKTLIDLDNATVLSMLPFQNKHIATMTLTGALTCRRYIPMFDSKIFALFGELRLNGKRGYTMDYQNTERGKYGAYTDNHTLSLGIYPGASLFLTDFCAVEVSIPVLEGGYSWSKQLRGGEPDNTQSHTFISYKPDFLGIRLGITYNL